MKDQSGIPIPEDLQGRYEVICDHVKQGTRVAAVSTPWVKGLVERIASQAQQISELRAKLEVSERDFTNLLAAHKETLRQNAALKKPVTTEELQKWFYREPRGGYTTIYTSDVKVNSLLEARSRESHPYDYTGDK